MATPFGAQVSAPKFKRDITTFNIFVFSSSVKGCGARQGQEGQDKQEAKKVQKEGQQEEQEKEGEGPHARSHD